MRLTDLFTDENAVSPVIGVILMVAITVILAAVIGTFVLGLGSSIQQSAPQATFSMEYSDSASNQNDTLEIVHSTGDSIDNTLIAAQVNGTTLFEDGSLGTGSFTEVDNSWSTGDSVTAGDTLKVEEDSSHVFSSGDTVRVTWTAENGENSATLMEQQIP